MIKKILLALPLLLVPLTSYSSVSSAEVFGQRSPLWESISTSRIIVATTHGLESIGTGKLTGKMNHIASVEGSGNPPIELEVVTGKYAFVLTDKTIDVYYISGDNLFFRSSVQLSKTTPKDFSFRDSDKIMITYNSGFEMFGVNFKGGVVYKIEGGLVDFIGEAK